MEIYGPSTLSEEASKLGLREIGLGRLRESLPTMEERVAAEGDLVFATQNGVRAIDGTKQCSRGTERWCGCSVRSMRGGRRPKVVLVG